MLIWKAYIMRTINPVRQACIMEGDYETTLGITVFDSINIRNGKKRSHNKVPYNYLASLHLKQIAIKEDHNSHTYSLFCLAVLARENLKKPFLIVAYRNQEFYVHF